MAIFALSPLIFLHHEGGPIITVTGSFSTKVLNSKIHYLEEILPTFRITLPIIYVGACCYMCCCRTSCVCAQILSGKYFFSHGNMQIRLECGLGRCLVYLTPIFFYVNETLCVCYNYKDIYEI